MLVKDSAISDIHTLTKFDIAGIHLANNKINLLSRTQSYTIPTKAGFPYIDKYDPQVTEMLTVDMQRVKEVYFAAAKNDSRAMLNAVCLCLGSDGQIIAYVATDAHRLSWSGTGNLAEFDQHKFMLLPRKLIDFMLKIKVDKFSFGYNPGTNHYRAVAELASDDTDNHTIEIIANDERYAKISLDKPEHQEMLESKRLDIEIEKAVDLDLENIPDLDISNAPDLNLDEPKQQKKQELEHKMDRGWGMSR